MGISNPGQAADRNTYRYLTERLCSQLHGYVEWGKRSVKEYITCKYPRTPSAEECYLSLYEREINQCNSYQLPCSTF